MSEIMKTELVFIPSPGVGHLVSTVEMANLLINRDAHLRISVLTIKWPGDAKLEAYIKSLAADPNPRIRFVELSDDNDSGERVPISYVSQLFEIHKEHIRDHVSGIVSSGSVKLAGLVIDMFCTAMIDLANEFGLPTYLFFTSGAAMLGLMFHLQSLRDDCNQDVTEYKGSNAELLVPTYVNPVPAKVLPSIVLDKESGGCTRFLNHARRYRETKGIVINTFLELETHAVRALSRANEENINIPPVYAVGPILSAKSGGDGNDDKHKMIMKWLDDQPDSSVVFLCFGSMGAFEADQVKEIAYALERSGQRFLWSLRRPRAIDKTELPDEYNNPGEVLPEGFLQRTAEIGKVIGWAPQLAVLSHAAVGGFVSHCGWNSTLESVWCGVPMATWPMYAEQQINAFQLLKDLGLAVEIKMDYYKDSTMSTPTLVTADQIQRAIRSLMEPENEIRRKVTEMKKNSRMALVEGGSSCVFLGRFIEDVKKNIAA